GNSLETDSAPVEIHDADFARNRLQRGGWLAQIEHTHFARDRFLFRRWLSKVEHADLTRNGFTGCRRLAEIEQAHFARNGFKICSWQTEVEDADFARNRILVLRVCEEREKQRRDDNRAAVIAGPNALGSLRHASARHDRKHDALLCAGIHASLANQFRPDSRS